MMIIEFFPRERGKGRKWYKLDSIINYILLTRIPPGAWREDAAELEELFALSTRGRLLLASAVEKPLYESSSLPRFVPRSFNDDLEEA